MEVDSTIKQVTETIILAAEATAKGTTPTRITIATLAPAATKTEADTIETMTIEVAGVVEGTKEEVASITEVEGTTILSTTTSSSLSTLTIRNPQVVASMLPTLPTLTTIDSQTTGMVQISLIKTKTTLPSSRRYQPACSRLNLRGTSSN